MARDVIFNKDEIWNEKSICLTHNKTQELDKAIEIVDLQQTYKQKDIQLAKDQSVDFLNPITQQINHKMKHLDQDKQANQDEINWVQSQYLLK